MASPSTFTMTSAPENRTDATYPTFGSFTLLADLPANASVAIDDPWDFPWTDEQRRLIESGAVPRQVLVALGLLLFIVVLFGLVANATILYVFSRFKRLRTPANVFIINLTLCDLFSCLIHPLAVYSSFRGRWSFGTTGCNLYGMGVGFFGLNSIVTLSAIACERYVVITSSSCRSVVAKWRITRAQARKICAGIWVHCAALVTPPWLFGWSSYQPEGALVSCSWDYTTRTLSNRLYYLYLLTFGFLIPVGVLAYCYAAIFRFIVRSSREMTRLIMTSDGRAAMSKTSISFRNKRRQTDVRTALIILSLALACFTAWTPYAVVSLVGQFAPLNDDEKLSPLLTSIPAFFAKTAIVFNPLVYGFSHPQFRSSVRQMLNQYSVESSANGPRMAPLNENNTVTMTLTRRRLLNHNKNHRLAAMVVPGDGPVSSSVPSGEKQRNALDPAGARASDALFRLVNGKVITGKGRLVVKRGKRSAANGFSRRNKSTGDVRRLSTPMDSRAESVHCSPSNSDDGSDSASEASRRTSQRDSGVSIQQQQRRQLDEKICPPHDSQLELGRRRASAPLLDSFANNEKGAEFELRNSGSLPHGVDTPAGSNHAPEAQYSSPVDGRCSIEWPAHQLVTFPFSSIPV